MKRDPQAELDKLHKQGVPIYSFSKVESMHGCMYEAYRTYILRERDKQLQNCYAILGSSVHDCLERLMNNQATEADLFPTVQTDLDMCDMLNIKFPSDAIRDNWVQDMTHFCKTYKKPAGTFETEQFFLYQTPKGRYLQGYIDLIRKNDNGTINIYDYKSSSLYKGDDIKTHSRQLILYALGREAQGDKVNRIGWIFLKYAAVEFKGKKTARNKEETSIVKVIERKNIVKELAPYIETKLAAIGIDEIEIEFIMTQAKQFNEIPKEVSEEFIIKPYVMYYELSDETRQECIEYLDKSIEEWEALSGQESDYPHISFTRKNRLGNEVDDSFYCHCLCGYRLDCKYLKEYDEQRNSALNGTDDDDLF